MPEQTALKNNLIDFLKFFFLFLCFYKKTITFVASIIYKMNI